jgi:hypothetical protein
MMMMITMRMEIFDETDSIKGEYNLLDYLLHKWCHFKP